MMKRTADEGPDGTPLEKKVNAMVQSLTVRFVKYKRQFLVESSLDLLSIVLVSLFHLQDSLDIGSSGSCMSSLPQYRLGTIASSEELDRRVNEFSKAR